MLSIKSISFQKQIRRSPTQKADGVAATSEGERVKNQFRGQMRLATGPLPMQRPKSETLALKLCTSSQFNIRRSFSLLYSSKIFEITSNDSSDLPSHYRF